ncbi:MAG: sulfite exporter TauE/SafE family protein [Gammaproteobacteria bacterium]|nr:sulfite exporter TauE/SafE family protein [Gammaproteobacteria bacterium]NIR83515.1 sulfite exporter TauE/SafE family protein [Gammaproteobacteria bacterium]NIR91437.1 sulfite exporter TauE/SafE family protein [Gammaproteobacteria bacterium]NIU04677.1 sulfite exporter TauE/SafE family protein [Gammaproteobacteria bacterium]NIV51719.1 sulfite exporter TauE/SafE family protein [Gammaproteobacteria bacterium]
MGLLGSVHCAGMCGGIACALTMGLPAAARRSPWRLLPWLLAYNAGRIGSYVLAGALAGLIGARSLDVLPLAAAQRVGLLVSGLFLALVGLSVGGWWPAALVGLERQGARIWRRVEPIGRRFIPMRTPFHALGAGAVWGWLPCGLVYAALVWSLAAGGAAQGALLMSAFGAGTLPMLLGVGALGRWLMGFTSRPAVRRAAGVAVLLLAMNVLAGALAGGHPGEHGGERHVHATVSSGVSP